MYNIKAITDKYIGKNVRITIRKEEYPIEYIVCIIKSASIDSIFLELSDGTKQTVKYTDLSFIEILD